MGTPDIRARIHQEGGTIVPRNAKALAIPINAPEGERPRDFLRKLGEKNFFVQRKGDGTGIIFQKLPGGQLSPLYVLRKSVTMRKRKFIQMLPENWDYLKSCIIRHILEGK
jgi:hypothetical protein